MRHLLSKALFTLFLVFNAIYSSAQSEIQFPFTGTFQLLPNSKLSYAYDKVKIESNSFTLFTGESVMGVYYLTGFDEATGYQVEPAANTGGSESNVIRIKMSMTNEGKLYTLVSGQGVNAEHYFEKLD